VRRNKAVTEEELSHPGMKLEAGPRNYVACEDVQCKKCSGNASKEKTAREVDELQVRDEKLKRGAEERGAAWGVMAGRR